MIRKAGHADIPQIVELIASNREHVLPRTAAEIESLIESFFVAEAPDGRIAGCSCLEIYSSKIAEVRSVTVAPEFRGCGYGTELVRAAVAEGKACGIYEILVVTSSPEFFQPLGFSACMNEKYALFYTGTDQPSKVAKD